MIDYLNAFIFGLVQGITEFLPVSSSGHLVVLHKFLALPNVNELAFDVTLHLATFLAVFWYFRSDIWRMIISWCKSFTGIQDEYSRLSWQIIIATIPAAILGFLFQDKVENLLRSAWWVVIMLVVVGGLFIVIERINKEGTDLNGLNWKKSLLIGLSQAIAFIPGTSRSGITIIAGMTAKLNREAAVRFSFLLSLPIIFGAALAKAPDIARADLSNYEYSIILVSFLSALISGFLAIKFFLKFSKNNSLNIFAYYRFVLAGVIILLLLL